MTEGKKKQISEASRSFIKSYSKENGKYVMICNDITSAFEYVSTRRHHCEMKIFHPKNELKERNTP